VETVRKAREIRHPEVNVEEELGVEESPLLPWRRKGKGAEKFTKAKFGSKTNGRRILKLDKI